MFLQKPYKLEENVVKQSIERKKIHWPRIMKLVKLFFKIEEYLLRQTKIEGIVANRPVLDEILKEVLQKEGKLYTSETHLHKLWAWRSK